MRGRITGEVGQRVSKRESKRKKLLTAEGKMSLIRLMGLMVVLLYASFPVDMSHTDVLLDEVDGRRAIGGGVAYVLENLTQYGWELVCVAGSDVVVRRKARGNNEVGSFKVQYRKD